MKHGQVIASFGLELAYKREYDFHRNNIILKFKRMQIFRTR